MFNPTNPNYGSNAAADTQQHINVPTNGRIILTADAAVMYVAGVAIGMIQRFAISENRPVTPMYELGNNYIAEFVPQMWVGQIQASRMTLYKNGFFDALQLNTALNATSPNLHLAEFWPSDKRAADGSAIISMLADIQFPIDQISLQITNPNPAQNQITVKNFVECWIESYSTAYDSGNRAVAENITFKYRNVNYQSVALDAGTINLATGAV